MKDVVSRSVSILILTSTALVGAGIVLPAFPLSSLVFAGAAAALGVWMATRRPEPTTAQVIWAVEAEPVRESARAARF